MEDRNQQVQRILQHIERIESELQALRQLVTNLADEDQDLIIVAAEPVVHTHVSPPAPVFSRTC
jgi:DNA-binding transcriptional LysR family regulator